MSRCCTVDSFGSVRRIEGGSGLPNSDSPQIWPRLAGGQAGGPHQPKPRADQDLRSESTMRSGDRTLVIRSHSSVAERKRRFALTSLETDGHNLSPV